MVNFIFICCPDLYFEDKLDYTSDDLLAQTLSVRRPMYWKYSVYHTQMLKF